MPGSNSLRPAPLALAPALSRALERMGRRDAATAPLALDTLARELLALRGPLDPRLARQLLASALGCRASLLPDPVDLRRLPSLVHGPVSDLPLERSRFVVVDLETTGLSVESCQILEIGAVRVEGLRRTARFQTLVDPGVPIPERITALTGIDRQQVDGAPDIRRVIADFRRWIGGGEAAFVAHNASFDTRFVRRALADHGHPPWAGPVLCTRKLARRILPELGRYNLDTLSAHLGITNRWRHRALGDAEATAQALLELIDRAREERGIGTLGGLLELQAARPGRSPGASRAPKKQAST